MTCGDAQVACPHGLIRPGESGVDAAVRDVRVAPGGEGQALRHSRQRVLHHRAARLRDERVAAALLGHEVKALVELEQRGDALACQKKGVARKR